MFNNNLREAREKERARARIYREINNLNREISDLENIRDSFIRKRSDLGVLNTEWNRNKNTYLGIEMVSEIEVFRKFEGEIGTALKNELPSGLKGMSKNVTSINNVRNGISDQIDKLNKKIEELNNQVAYAHRRFNII